MSCHAGSGEPWHSTGDITSAFYLLNRWPTALNPMYIAIAKNESLWEPTFEPIVYKSIHKVYGTRYGRGMRCKVFS